MSGLHFSFMTAAFVDSAEARAERVNELVGGHALAVWLSGAIKDAGFAAGAPWVEDHGWDFDIKDGERTYLCVCSIDDDESLKREAHVSISLSRSIKDRLFGRNRFDPTDQVAQAIERILRGAAEITGLEKEVTR